MGWGWGSPTGEKEKANVASVSIILTLDSMWPTGSHSHPCAFAYKTELCSQNTSKNKPFFHQIVFVKDFVTIMIKVTNDHTKHLNTCVIFLFSLSKQWWIFIHSFSWSIFCHICWWKVYQLQYLVISNSRIPFHRSYLIFLCLHFSNRHQWNSSPYISKQFTEINAFGPILLVLSSILLRETKMGQ